MAKPKITWVGNGDRDHRELHRVEEGVDQPAGCQLFKVPMSHRVYFRRAHLALNPAPESGWPKYDACSYCTRRFKSRR
jgi:hypothetical protein